MFVLISLIGMIFAGHNGGRTRISVWRGPSKKYGYHKHASFGYNFKHPAPRGGYKGHHKGYGHH